MWRRYVFAALCVAMHARPQVPRFALHACPSNVISVIGVALRFVIYGSHPKEPALAYQSTECPARRKPSATLSTVNSAYMRRRTAPLVWHLQAPRLSGPEYRALPLPLRLVT